jgi:hypothetical protein
MVIDQRAEQAGTEYPRAGRQAGREGGRWAGRTTLVSFVFSMTATRGGRIRGRI